MHPLPADRPADGIGSQTVTLPVMCGNRSDDACWSTAGAYVPLGQRTANELLANACELRRMAATATTQDVVKALLGLADRYAALSQQRRQREMLATGS
jgi:hypothetical protein